MKKTFDPVFWQLVFEHLVDTFPEGSIFYRDRDNGKLMSVELEELLDKLKGGDTNE